MSKMIERVAKAIEDECAGCDPRDTAAFTAAARKAIAAIREPTDAMVQAGWPHTADPCWDSNVADAWRAMIDVALVDAATPRPGGTASGSDGISGGKGA